MIKKILLGIFLLICVSLIFLGSPYGLTALTTLTQKLTDNQVQLIGTSGSLLRRFSIDQLVFRNQSQSVIVQNLQLSWRPWDLARGRLHIQTLSCQQLLIEVKKAKPSPTTTSKPTFNHLLPELVLSKLHINALTFHNLSNKEAYQAQNIQANATLTQGQLHANLNAKINQLLHLSNLQLKAQLNGTPSHYDFNALLQGKKTHVQLYGHGQPGQVNIEALDSQIPPYGHIDLNALIHWQAPFHIQAKISSKGLYWHQQKFLGHLRTQFYNIDHFNVDAEISSTLGHLKLQGHHQADWQLRWQLTANHLERAFSRLSGSLSSQGSIIGDSQRPTFTGKLHINQLGFSDWDINQLQANWLIDSSDQLPSNISAQANGISSSQLNLTKIKLTIQGLLHQHNSQLQAISANNQINIQGQGQLALNPASYTFNAQQWTLNSQALGNWQLGQPFKLHWQQKQFSLQPFCWQGKAQDKFCLALQKKNEHWQVKHSAHFNLLHYPQLFPGAAKLSGALNSELKAQGKNLQLTALKAELRADALQGQFDRIKQKFNQAILSASLTQPKQLQLNSSLKNDQGDHLNVMATLNSPSSISWPLATHANLAAKLSLQWKTLAWLNAVLPTQVRLNGSANLSSTLSGQLNNPKLSLKADLNHATVGLPDLGLKLTGIQLQAHNKSSKLHYQLQLSSNQKPLSAKGIMDLKNWSLNGNSEITGQAVPLMSTLDYDIVASPQIRMVIERPKINITGKVSIDHALISPQAFNSSVSLPKQDIIYVNRPLLTKQWQPKLKLQLALGEKTRVDSHGLTGHLVGNLALSQTPDTPLMANGKIRLVDAKFDSHGHKLTIDRAVIHYLNSPIENPQFNVTASRKFNQYNSAGISMLGVDDLTVGVSITGNAHHQKFRFFSHPVTLSQGDILSYLLLGHAASASSAADLGVLLQSLGSGQGSGLSSLPQKLESGLGLSEFGIQSETSMDLQGNPIDSQNVFVIGKYLTPKIYLRYSRGLVDATSTITLRYLITPEWALQTDSSNVGSGGDVIYSFYRH
jgi:autotransporter translocation and assembly factor TamB